MADEKSFGERLGAVRWEAIVVEEGDFSLGRVMSWVVFASLLQCWYRAVDVPPTMMEAFWGLLIYNGGKKVTTPLRKFLVERASGGSVKAAPRRKKAEAEEVP